MMMMMMMMMSMMKIRLNGYAVDDDEVKTKQLGMTMTAGPEKMQTTMTMMLTMKMPGWAAAGSTPKACE
jgi:hypothetical protein